MTMMKSDIASGQRGNETAQKTEDVQAVAEKDDLESRPREEKADLWKHVCS